jgi:type I restriction enzyme M protein
MPDSSTSVSATREQRIRGAMIERGVVRCVVALPSHLFRETTAPVTVWILEQPTDEADRGVLLIDAREGARKDDPTHRVLTGRSRRSIVDSYRTWLTGTAPLPIAVDDVIATAVSVAELREHGYDLQPVTYRDRRRGEAAEKRLRERLRTLPTELARLDAAARQADAALEHRLRELGPWTR